MIDKDEVMAFAAMAAVLAVAGTAFAGWVMNIAAIWRLAHQPFSTEIVIRIIGVFPFWPLGCVFGWLN